MLSKNYRLKERSDFRRIYQRGKSLACPYFIMYFRNYPENTPLIGFSVSKKIGNAVTRNRQRRRMSELCRRNIFLFPEHKKYIFIICNAMKRADNQKLEAALGNMLGQI